MTSHQKYSILFLFVLIFILGALSACSSSTGNNQSEFSPTPHPTQDEVYEKAQQKQLASMNTEAASIYKDATDAYYVDDYASAKSLYEAVIARAPDFGTAYRRLGNIESYYGNDEKALGLYQKAYELQPDAYSDASYASALLSTDDQINHQKAFDMAKNAHDLDPTDEFAMAVLDQAALINKDTDTLRETNDDLLQHYPNSVYGHFFAGFIDALDYRYDKAEKEFLLSEKLGMPSDYIQKILDSGVSRNARLTRILIGIIIATLVWLFIFLLLYLVGKRLSNVTLRATTLSSTKWADMVTPKEKNLRSFYRVVIQILSVYYFISIPFVILFLFLVVGGAFYFFASSGTVPVYLAFILIVMLFGSLIAILKTFLGKRKDTLPGRAVTRSNAPELWHLVDEVAKKLGTRTLDNIYITPGVSIGVYEKGGMLKGMRNANPRNLILGIGALSGLTQEQFAAILAHEFGHFSNRDTAGGDMAGRVNGTLREMAIRLYQAKSARPYNPVWLFLYIYQKIYLNVTCGASRLQEMLADRFAVLAYGSETFKQALTNHVKQSIAFEIIADHEIKNSKETHIPVINLYDLPVKEEYSQEISRGYQKEYYRPTFDHDTHPSLKERIEMIEKLPAENVPQVFSSRSALNLFPNPEQIELEMTRVALKIL